MTKRTSRAAEAPQAPDRAAPDPAAPDFAPVPRKCKRHDGWTPARQRAFIDALADTGSVKAACAVVNMATEGAFMLRRQPGADAFAAAWDAAQAHAIGILRDALMHRAIHGVEVPVYSYGKLVGTRRKYNDRIGTFLLANYDGQLIGGASGMPLRLKRIVDQEVEKARAEWEEAQRRDYEEVGARVRQRMDEVRRLMIAGRPPEQDDEHPEIPPSPTETTPSPQT